MDSSLRAFKNAATLPLEPQAPALSRRAAVGQAAALAVLGPALLLQPAQAAIDITNMRVDRIDDALYLYASIPITLPPAVEDALLKGIAIYFVAEVDITRERWYWTDLAMARATRTWRLAFQPLSRRWRLTVSSKDAALTQNYESQAEALAAMSRIARWRIAEGAGADDRRNVLTFRFRLDTTQLPRPLQMGVVGLSDWNMQASRSIVRYGANQ
jgi:hypothetical protein